MLTFRMIPWKVLRSHAAGCGLPLVVRHALPTGIRRLYASALRLACTSGLVMAASCAEVPREQPMTTRMPYDEALRGSVGGTQSYVAESRTIPGFAGVYAEGCDIIVLSTKPDSSTAKAQERFAADLPSAGECWGEVRVRGAPYTWADLARWHEQLAPGGTIGVVGHGANVIRNRVVVAVEDEAAAKRVREAVHLTGIPAGAVLIAITGPVPPPPPRYMLRVHAQRGEAPGPVTGVTATVASPGGGALARGTTDAGGDWLVALDGKGEYEVRVSAPRGYQLAAGQAGSKRVWVGAMDEEPTYAGFYFVRRPTSR